jgi:hypothetical protein
MNGQIILPKFYETRHTDNYKILLSSVAEAYNLRLTYTDHIRIQKNDEIIITHGIPHHSFPNYDIRPLLDKPDRTRLISWLRDPWCMLSQQPRLCMERYESIIDVSDVVLQFANSWFRENFPDWSHKTVFFPQFVAPKERYELAYNAKKIRRCLLSGAVGDFYPLRTKVGQSAPANMVQHIPPPYRGQHGYVKDAYARLLGQYFCCVTDGGLVNAAMAKHVEIPASGSLLICNQTADLDVLGFVPGTHYVKVNSNNVIDTIRHVLSNPKQYEKVAERGRSHALANHTVENRISLIENIINRTIPRV